MLTLPYFFYRRLRSLRDWPIRTDVGTMKTSSQNYLRVLFLFEQWKWSPNERFTHSTTNEVFPIKLFFYMFTSSVSYVLQTAAHVWVDVSNSHYRTDTSKNEGVRTALQPSKRECSQFRILQYISRESILEIHTISCRIGWWLYTIRVCFTISCYSNTLALLWPSWSSLS